MTMHFDATQLIVLYKIGSFYLDRDNYETAYCFEGSFISRT